MQKSDTSNVSELEWRNKQIHAASFSFSWHWHLNVFALAWISLNTARHPRGACIKGGAEGGKMRRGVRPVASEQAVSLLFSISKSHSPTWLAWALLHRSSLFFFLPVVADREGREASSLLCSTVCVCTTVHTCFESCSADVRWILTSSCFFYFLPIPPFSLHSALYMLVFILFLHWSQWHNTGPTVNDFICKTAYRVSSCLKYFLPLFLAAFLLFFFQLLRGKVQAREVYEVRCHRKFNDSSRQNKCVTAIDAFLF